MITLTLVIPVYNEERHIKGCLDAIAAQSVPADEVIVVDNNCTDKTIELAAQYPFVTVIRETRQGRGWARSTGFSHAKSDIIGRIDADSRIAVDWVGRVKERFESDSSLMGITGLAYTSVLPGNNQLKLKLFSRAYYWIASFRFNTVTMWGANMAMRRTAWEQVASKVCNDDRLVHEDEDVSLWLASRGAVIAQDSRLIMTTNGQTYRYLPKLLQYWRLFSLTKRIHLRNGNLSDPRLKKLGVIRTFPGMVLAVLLGLYLFTCSVLFFPIDTYFIHRNKDSDWF